MERNRGVIGNIAQRPLAFICTFFILFALAYAFLGAVDALPEPRTGTVSISNEAVAPQTAQLPVRIVAPAVGVDATIENPSSTDISALDEALEGGAVRYPTSAPLGVDGTVLLFGHSTSISFARPFYKTFNDIQKLQTGEIVSVYSGSTEYRYAVTGVRLADAEEDIVELPQDGQYLTLVTCNTFAQKSARFIVEAELIGTYSL